MLKFLAKTILFLSIPFMILGALWTHICIAWRIGEDFYLHVDEYIHGVGSDER